MFGTGNLTLCRFFVGYAPLRGGAILREKKKKKARAFWNGW